jgi:hypothetical protein
MVTRNLLRDHLADPHPGHLRPARSQSSAATGASKTGCTGSATWTGTKTGPRSAPPADRASWPALTCTSGETNQAHTTVFLPQAHANPRTRMSLIRALASA